LERRKYSRRGDVGENKDRIRNERDEKGERRGRGGPIMPARGLALEIERKEEKKRAYRRHCI